MQSQEPPGTPAPTSGASIEQSTAAHGRVVLETLQSGIALIRLGPPSERVVSLTFERLRSFREALEQVRSMKPRGLIIAGPGAEMFTVGADIGAIKDVSNPTVGEQLAREGQKVFGEVEALPCPTVAAISGPCMGGGCELSLACTYRVMSDHRASQIGLPEVKLGIIPGFGGTQRLPRLVGLTRALDIILAGKVLRPSQALRAGLVDAIVPYDGVIARSEELLKGSRRARALPLRERLLTWTALGRRFVFKKAQSQLHRQTKGFYPAPPSALAAVRHGLENGLESGLAFEARELGKMIVTPESKALVHVFLLSEAAKGLAKGGRKAVEHLHTIVIGAGAMGAGIAGSLARAECTVLLKDTTDAALKRGLEQIREGLSRSKHLTESERSFILNRIEASTRDISNAGNAGFAIEAIFEELAIKQKVLGELARLLPREAILATNTSSLSVTAIQEGIENPSRVIGMHFFNPVEKMPLVEVVHGERTEDRAIVVVAALAGKLGKFPIVVRDVPGFLVNRILGPYLTEAAWLISEGYSVSDIDKVATGFGMPMGPVRLLDEVGLDIAMHVSETLGKAYPDRMQGPGLAARMVKAGRLGKKSGGGFYDFAEEKATPHPGVRSILGITTSQITHPDRELIQDRLILSLVQEAVRSLDEGVAGYPGRDAAGQIDLGSVMGFGFPPFRGGVLWYAERRGAKNLYERLKFLADRIGIRFAPCDGIRLRAERGMSFYDKL